MRPDKPRYRKCEGIEGTTNLTYSGGLNASGVRRVIRYWQIDVVSNTFGKVTPFIPGHSCTVIADPHVSWRKPELLDWCVFGEAFRDIV